MNIKTAFELATLLFLATEELLVDTQKGKQNPSLTAAFFEGFLLFMLLPGGGQRSRSANTSMNFKI